MQFVKTMITGISLAALSGGVFAESTLLMSMSFDSLKGKFGRTEETKVQVINTGITMVGEAYRASVFLPYLKLDGPGTVVGGTVAGSGTTRRNASGLGDMLATLSFDVIGKAHEKGVYAGTTGLIKLPTGDEGEGLSTGATDYGVQLDLGYRFNRSFALSGNYGRNFYGESDTVVLKDGSYYSVGTNIGLTDSFTVVLSMAQRDALVDGSPKRKENTVTAVYGVTPTTAIQLTAINGKTDSSPDSVISIGFIVQP